jgi:hypothetical protein
MDDRGRHHDRKDGALLSAVFCLGFRVGYLTKSDRASMMLWLGKTVVMARLFSA